MMKYYYIPLLLIFSLIQNEESFEAKEHKYPDQTISAKLVNRTFSKLPWTIKELESISEIVDGKIYFGQNATEEEFKKSAPNAGIIHLATHAIINDKEPLLSEFVFSKDNDDTEDGSLITYELYNMKLNAELVVLSACNTGSGKLHRAEGIMSLARGFMYAGCPSIIMSLWSVDDRSTSILMKSFYENLAKGDRKDQAIRKAKLEFIESADEVRSNPYYWAGMVSIGNTSPIKLKQKPNFRFFFYSTFATTVLILAFRKKIRCNKLIKSMQNIRKR